MINQHDTRTKISFVFEKFRVLFFHNFLSLYRFLWTFQFTFAYFLVFTFGICVGNWRTGGQNWSCHARRLTAVFYRRNMVKHSVDDNHIYGNTVLTWRGSSTSVAVFLYFYKKTIRKLLRMSTTMSQRTNWVSFSNLQERLVKSTLARSIPV